MTSFQDERRGTMRIHAVWQRIAREGFPKRSQIDPKAFGADWSNCLIIELDSGTPQPRFAYRGDSLLDHAFPSFDENCISQRLAETLLTLVGKHIPRVLATRIPLGYGGSALHAGHDILYRIVLLPLSEDGKRIDGLLAAITYRDVPEAEELPLSDMTWCNRTLSQDWSQPAAHPASRRKNGPVGNLPQKWKA